MEAYDNEKPQENFQISRTNGSTNDLSFLEEVNGWIHRIAFYLYI